MRKEVYEDVLWMCSVHAVAEPVLVLLGGCSAWGSGGLFKGLVAGLILT